MRKRVLITGGTGFLGRRLGMKMKADYDVVLGARNNKQNWMAGQYTGCKTIPLDITSMDSVRDAIVEVRPHIVIHAAATKFVDLSELQPFECVDVNVVGSQNVARVCMDKGVETVIGISTDKAAPPVRNTYALSKALMERMFCSLSGKTETKFACVRFGNLAWSTGSVLPIWKKMHDDTGVIGTTGPEMRRFFITVEEACEIILNALNNIDVLSGQVLTRRMKAVQIGDMLDLWIAKKGGRVERITGRPGERDDEYLVGESERPYASEHVFGGVTHYAIDFNRKNPNPIVEELSSATMPRLSEEEILAIVMNPPPADELW
jgi:FlaA1/EpsC-like NDP-sugar epimerase